MGCGGSKCCGDGNASPPAQFQLEQLAPVRPGQQQQPFKAPPELTKGDLELGLNQVAQHLRKKGRTVNVVVVGGAVSTILLRTRRSTHDIDFFAEGLARQDGQLLLEAANIVRKQPGSRLEEDWINNRTIYFINPTLRQELTRKGFEQNDIVFQAPGLTLYAAPWSYAFVSKLDRIKGGGFRPHDPADAAVYLDKWMRRERQNSISAQRIRDTIRTYQLSVGMEQDFSVALGIVNDAFEQMFGRRPVRT